MLAISDEQSKTVQDFLDKNGYTVRTAAGSNASGGYGVKGIPASFLIGPDGKLLWSGHPSGLSKGTIKEALKGAKGGRLANFLVYEPSGEYGKALSAAVENARSGKLGKALQAARAMAADEAAAEADRSQAQDLSKELADYVGELGRQVEAMVESKDLLRATQVLETLGRDLGNEEEGKSFRDRLSAMRADKALMREVDALEAWEKAKSGAARLATSKAREKFADFAEKWSGTRAGNIARAASMRKDG